MQAWGLTDVGTVRHQNQDTYSILQLDKQSDNNCELVDLFNSDATEEEFLAQLKVCREKAPKAIAYLIRRIKKQEFNEEQPIEE